MNNLLQLQIELEKESLQDAKSKAESIFHALNDKGKGSRNNEAIILIKKSLQPVTNVITNYINNKAIRGKASHIREPILFYKDNEISLAYLVLAAIMDSVLQPSGGRYPPFHCTITRAARNIVNKIKLEYKLKLVDDSLDDSLKLSKFDEIYSKLPARKRLQKKLLLANKLLTLDDNDNIEGVQLGVNLIDAVIKSNVGLISVKTVVEGKNKKKSYIYLTNNVIKSIGNMQEVAPFFVFNYPPFIFKPKPWEGFNGSGGYYSDFIDIPLVKIYNDKYNKKQIANYFETHPNKTKRFFNVLNNIQNTEWRINNRLLEVYNTIYRKQIKSYKEDLTYLGGLPTDDFPNPYEEIPIPDGTVGEEFVKLKRKVITLEENIVITRSKLLSTKLGLSVANKFSKYKKLYFTYQVDFRGRVYPIQQHLNPQAAKHLKPLLEFAEGKSLDTKEAYNWFMIHGANVYGYDKLTYTDRIKKMEEMKNEILRCAKNPYKHTEWENADQPFAFLSWCYEYSDYCTNPDSFKSHIPIALDASCSGIQIYSGLLLDAKGAKAVNVLPSGEDKVADIYQDVADVVNRILETSDYEPQQVYHTRKKGEASERYIDCKTIGDNMCGRVNRKMTKRNVMTFPYNVSSFGMKDQLKDEIYMPMYKAGNPVWGEAQPWQVALFMAQLNNRAIKEVVEGAVLGRDFLKTLTKELVKKGKYVYYTTPEFNFPVLHRVTKYQVTRITTALAKLSLKTPTTTLNLGSMVNGIAPNYIHSLDATLMFLTLEKLLEDDVTDFALIHDSYGVHAKDADKLSLRVREAFIQLFKSKPLLSFVKQVAPNKLKEAEELMMNNLNLKEVMKSGYFFS